MTRIILALLAALYAYLATPADAASASRKCLTYEAWQLLDRIELAHGPVQVISTCRPGARVAGTGRISRHASGNAIDFRAGNRKAAIVAWLIEHHKTGGTMTYARKDHIHVDIGPRFVSLNSGGKSSKRVRFAAGKTAAPAKIASRANNWAADIW